MKRVEKSNRPCAVRWLAKRRGRPKSDHTGDFGSPPSLYLPALLKERRREVTEGRRRGRIGTDRGRQTDRI